MNETKYNILPIDQSNVLIVFNKIDSIGPSFYINGAH